MVRGLIQGINHHSQDKNKPTIVPVSSIPKNGEKLKVIIDGTSLAYLILTAKDKEHSWEFVNGGDYIKYNNKLIEYFKLLEKLGIESTIVFPLPEGTPPINESNNNKWKSKAEDKIKRVSRVRNLLEKAGGSSRGLLDVLPPFIFEEIRDIALRSKIEVHYTRNSVLRYISHSIHNNEADAVIGLNSDYILFSDVNYIPIDSFHTNEQNINVCELLNSKIACELIGLVDPTKLPILSILLGNLFTESFITHKHNMHLIMKIKANQKNPSAYLDGLVLFLNQEDFQGLFNTPPLQELFATDNQFNAAALESLEFFSFDKPLEPEGDSLVIAKVHEHKLPMWAISVFEGGDFWYEPIVDDYIHEVKTSQATLPIRKILYSILGRKTVTEHIPDNEVLTSITVDAEEGIPSLEDLSKFSETKLKTILYQIIHMNFPKPPATKTDPLSKIPEPLYTIGLALRNLVAQCFTENCSASMKINESTPASIKDAKVKSAPPVDLFELRTLAAMAVVLNQIEISKFTFLEYKPRIRRLKVSALYQSILQHIIWLQELFGLKTDKLKPHRIFDGQLFSAIYDVNGDLTQEKFALLYEEPDKIIDLDSKFVNDFLAAILHPFPKDLFDVFAPLPRSLYLSNESLNKAPAPVLLKAVSRFATLLDDDEEEDDAPAPPPPSITIVTPPPPPPSKPVKEKKEEVNEDDELEFLMAAASKKDPSQAPKIVTQQKKKPTTVHKRKVEVTGDSKQVFNKESKNEVKRQLKQKAHDW